MVTSNKALLITRLEKYLHKLKSGEKVAKRDLKSVLTPAELQSIDFEWENAKAYKDTITDMCDELSSYTAMLHTADKIFNIAENGHNLPKSQRDQRYKDAEIQYERALEHLQEILASNIGLEIALDRPVSFEAGEAPTASSADVPRYVFSRSQHTEPKNWQTIRSIKIDALQSKLDTVHRTAGNYSPNTSAPSSGVANSTNVIRRGTNFRSLSKK